MKSDKLTGLQKDVLREIGNIGAGNATTSLSELIHTEVQMEVPSVNLVTINELIDMIGGPEKVVATLLSHMKGDITGTVFFVLSIEEAKSVIRQMTGTKDIELFSDGQIDELAASVLTETANILTGSYLSALADFTKLHMKPTIPFLSIDMAAATLVTGLIEISQVADYALIVDTKITGTGKAESAKGQFLLIPAPQSIPDLFTALGIQYDK